MLLLSILAVSSALEMDQICQVPVHFPAPPCHQPKFFDSSIDPILNPTSILSSSQYSIVLIYAAGCPFSQNAKPTFYTLGSCFCRNDQVAFIAIDGSYHLSFTTQFFLRGFPSILIFKDRQVLGSFSGDHSDLESVQEFITTNTKQSMDDQSTCRQSSFPESQDDSFINARRRYLLLISSTFSMIWIWHHIRNLFCRSK